MNLTHPSRQQREQAMTLVEVMITGTVMVFVIGGFLAMHILALRYDATLQLKLQACNDARNAINQVATDIRSAGRVRIGHGSATNFTEISVNQRQEGNAITIYPSKANTNSFITYFRDSGDALLKRAVSGSANVVILARSVTNALVFASEDAQGQVLSNNFNNRVIGVTLKFYQNPNGNGSAGKKFLYDYYQVHTRVTRRALE